MAWTGVKGGGHSASQSDRQAGLGTAEAVAAALEPRQSLQDQNMHDEHMSGRLMA